MCLSAISHQPPKSSSHERSIAAWKRSSQRLRISDPSTLRAHGCARSARLRLHLRFPLSMSTPGRAAPPGCPWNPTKRKSNKQRCLRWIHERSYRPYYRSPQDTLKSIRDRILSLFKPRFPW